MTTFAPQLSHRSAQRRVVPPDHARPSDQFLPAAAIDRQKHDLWVCYCDTRADPLRRRAPFECQVSSNGPAAGFRGHTAASVESDETAPGAFVGPGNDYGDYVSVVAAGGVAHPFWTDSRDLARAAEEIYTTELRRP